MRIVAFSDWHGHWYRTPPADLYLCTGDMLENYIRPEGIDYAREQEHQYQEVMSLGNRRKYLGCPDAPVITCQGNHDFTELVSLFGADTEVYDIGVEATTFTVAGLRIGGFRGIPFSSGYWSDEKDEATLDTIARSLTPDIDILVSHAPPWGILDNKPPRYPTHWGMKALSAYVQRQFYQSGPLKLHCFGHVHEAFGTCTQGNRHQSITFVNAATGYVLLELDKDGCYDVLERRSASSLAPFRVY